MKKKQIYSKLVLIAFGTLLMGIGVKWFYDSSELVTGGFSGISIMLKSVSLKWTETGLPLWLTTLLLNIPLFMVCYKKMGKTYFWMSLFGMICLSVWLLVLPDVQLEKPDLLLASTYGGAISGLGLGLILRNEASTGGVDLLASMLHEIFPGYSIAQIMQVLDGMILLTGAALFGVEKALYALLAVMVTAKLSDFVVEGVHFSKIAYIVSAKHELISEQIMSELKRGVTAFDAQGMYQREHRVMLMCAVPKKELVRLKKIVLNCDANAFIMIVESKEVLGEGFRQNH